MTLNHEADRRQHDRLYNHATVKLTTQSQASIAAYTLNLSTGGMLIRCDLEPFPEIGDILNVHSMVFPEAPIKNVIVRRIAEAGVIGVEFMLV